MNAFGTIPLALTLAGAAAAPAVPTLTVEEAAPAPGRHLHAGAASLQLGAILALAAGGYEWQIELNKRDFDFARSFDGQWRRLTTGAGYRFDDNERYVNVGHAFMGAAYHQTARAHGAGLAQAYLFDLVTSTAWETIVEHREVVSVNDTIITGIGGAPLGEAMFQVSDLFARSRPTLKNRLLMGLMAPLRLAAWLGGDETPGAGWYDRRGMDASTYHRFGVAVGGQAGNAATATAPSVTDWSSTARADFEVVTLPAYARATDEVEQQVAASLRGGEMTRLVVDYAAGAQGFRAFDLFARATLFGRYEQRLTAGRAGARGSSRVLGAASAFELAYDAAGGVTDFLTLAHLAGPTSDLSWYRGPLALRAEMSAYGDFALARPMALGPGMTGAAFPGTKSTLEQYDYYYGWGGTAALRLEAAYGRLRAGAAAEWNHVDSIEGLDRHQQAYTSPTGVDHAAVTDDSGLTDDRLKARAFVEAPVPFVEDVSLGVAGDLVHRTGEWREHALTGTQDDVRVAVTLRYAL